MHEHAHHRDLSRTYLDHLGMSVAARSEVGLRASSFPDNLGAPRHRYPSAETLRDLFEGTQADTSSPPQICLHAEEVPRARSDDSYE